MEISVGREIKIYWRGDRTVYDATIISSGKDLPKIQVQYHNDGECWEYDYIKLKHKTGVYKNLKVNSKSKLTLTSVEGGGYAMSIIEGRLKE